MKFCRGTLSLAIFCLGFPTLCFGKANCEDLLYDQTSKNILVFQINDLELYQKQLNRVNWNNLKGQSIAIQYLHQAPSRDFAPSLNSAIEQNVLGPEHFSFLYNQQIQHLLRNSYFASDIRPPRFQETGLIIATSSDGKLFSSELFNSGLSDYLEMPAIFEELEAFLSRLKASHELESIVEISLIHTHPGKNSPLSSDDLFSTYAFLYPKIKNELKNAHTLKIMAAPIENNGEILFEASADLLDSPDLN